jgi:very-short-patch-repair endonuclease
VGTPWRLCRNMSYKADTADLRVAEIADRQHGVVSVRQLIAAGIDRHGVSYRARTGRLHRIHHGVYGVGHSARSDKARWMAGVLACGRQQAWGVPEPDGEEVGDLDSDWLKPEVSRTVLEHWGAAVSHHSGAQLWDLLPTRNGPADVLVPGTGGKEKRKGIRLHRSRSLLPAHVTLRDGIPVTTPARTIADLRRVVSKRGGSGLISPWELRRAIRQADVLGLPLGDRVEGDGTRSDLEGDFLRLCRRHRLPTPAVNVRVGPHLVDFLWRDRKLVVETDSFIYHGGRTAFQDDRARDLDLRARGYEVIRLAEKQVNEEPRRVAEVVSAALRVSADGRD